jgi:hypothetical protein
MRLAAYVASCDRPDGRQVVRLRRGWLRKRLFTRTTPFPSPRNGRMPARTGSTWSISTRLSVENPKTSLALRAFAQPSISPVNWAGACAAGKILRPRSTAEFKRVILGTKAYESTVSSRSVRIWRRAHRWRDAKDGWAIKGWTETTSRRG